MTHVPHELAADFTEHADTIHALKEENGYFARLMDEYHAINRKAHRAETNVEPMTNETDRAQEAAGGKQGEPYQILKAEA